jgi:hypothetical protein
MNSVTPMPRQCRRTSPMAAKSTLISMGMIISQISSATGRLTCAISAAATAWNSAGRRCPSAMPARMQSATQRLR